MNGFNAGGTAAGLVITSGNSVVRGLVINQFGNSGIFLLPNGGNVIVGNYIGTDITGQVARPNGVGVVMDGSRNNRIGGTTAADRNLISGNTDGIGIFVGSATGNIIEGNYIGTDASGTEALGNRNAGIFITFSASNNIIGGTGAGAGNLIAFNGGNGIEIGTDTIDLAVGNAIHRNHIFSNAGLGIDLAQDGVTKNDPGDADTGPNELQNYPFIKSATSSTSTLVGALNSTANTRFTIEFFANEACDSSGHGEGGRYLGSAKVRTNAKDVATFTFVTPFHFTAGDVITATATDPNGNTSEFSTCRTAS